MPTGGKLKRKEITYFDGINSLVGDNISKIEEFLMSQNVRSTVIGQIEKRRGYKLLGDALSTPTEYGMYYFNSSNASSTGFFRVTLVGATRSIYYLNTSDVWTALTGGGTGLTSTYNSFFTIANKKLFMVNGVDANRYVSSDGTTVVTSITDTGDLYGSPIARKIAYYKDRLYVADYLIGSNRYQTSIMKSSYPVGIVSLVNADASSIVAGTEVQVTETKYIQTAEMLDVYRGSVKVADITTTAKTENTITIGTITYSGSFTSLLAADEIWANDTYSTNARVFRWALNPQSGVDVKQYDTFKLTGGNDEAVTLFEPIGDVLMISNNSNIGVWNDSNLKMFDVGIGCCSERGYVKGKGLLFFISYDGIYATSGGMPTLLTAKVQKYFDGATKAGLEAASVGKKGNSIFAHIGTVTLYKEDGSVDKTLSNVVIEYNLQQKNNFVHTDVNAKEFRTYKSSSDTDRLIFSNSTTGNLYEFLYNTYSDDDGVLNKEIPIEATTGYITMASGFEYVCYPQEIMVEIKAGTDVKMFCSIDGGRYFEIKKSLKKGINIIGVVALNQDGIPLRGRTISLSFREMSGRFIKLGRIALNYYETLERDE